MKFGEKLKLQRKNSKLRQEDVAAVIGVTKWTLANYEKGLSRPQNRSVYFKLADYFQVNVNYFLTEDEEFITEAARQFGKKGGDQAEAILKQASALFAGGELSEEDQIAFLHEIQGLFLDSKRRAKEKFAAKSQHKG